MSLIALQKKVGANPDGSWGPNTYRAAMFYFNLNPFRVAHFFAQTAHETGEFSTFTENLNYSAEGLRRTFGKYFSTNTLAQQYARQPEKIANRVYANRMGNGPESSGDGWKYRGRGAIQLTGKDNYKAFADYARRQDVMINPDIVATELAFESAMFFFDKNKIWAICDTGVSDGTIESVSRRINGGVHGLADRIEKTKKYIGWANDMRLSKNFSLNEMTKSETAIRQKLPNSPGPEHVQNLKVLCEKILDRVRDNFNKPVRIHSGYRSPALNSAVGGSSGSQHCLGEAIDFEIDGISNVEVAEWIAKNCEYDQLILEFYNPSEGPNSGWIHVSYTSTHPNRMQPINMKREWA